MFVNRKILQSGVAWHFGTAVQQQLSATSSIGAAFEYLRMEDAQVASAAVLAGSYNDPKMYFLSLNYNYLF